MRFNRAYSLFSILVALLLVGAIAGNSLSQSRRQPPSSNEKKNKRPGETPKKEGDQQEPLPPDVVPTKPQDIEKVTISTQIVNVDAVVYHKKSGQIVTNLYYDELRRKVRNQDVISLDEPVESEDGTKNAERAIADTTTQPDKAFQRMELVQALGEALEKIPQQFRQSVLLREVDGLSYEEIAVITNTELGTVKSRISRARVKIQAQLAPYLKESA